MRLWFGYERYDHPDVWPLMNTLCRGALHQLLNYFLPTMKPAKKERVGSKTVRTYSPTQTPLERALACAEVSAATQAPLRAEKAALNPLARRREVDRQLQAIEAVRHALGAGLARRKYESKRLPRNGSEGSRKGEGHWFPSFSISGGTG